ncbi:MAG: class I SAM-dependent methyltransferase [Chloroflexi bacterium]|nr:class I SAM-dependent methyltransferase [Chloroflexota bacterium]
MAGSVDDDPPEAVRVVRRATFNTDPTLYDRARPGYPTALFDDLADISRVLPPARVLEIAPGTGKATQPLAERGYQVTAVELGAELAEFARRKLAGFEHVRIVTAAFEEWPLPAEQFDLVACAQAFHWLDPAVRLQKTAAALRAGGSLAVFGHHHVAGGDRAFFDQVQRCYERFMPGTPPGLTLPDPRTRPHEYATLFDGSVLFEPPVFRRYLWQQRYSTGEYLEVLSTYSGHIDLAPPNREALFECIARLIETGYGGSIEKAYSTDLAIARRR